MPSEMSVLTTRLFTIGPLIRPSLPITTFLLPVFLTSQDPKADVNLTISSGDKESPGFPPMVPLIPEILFINATSQGDLGLQTYIKKAIGMVQVPHF
jgi:hypothetical protein